jgi:hypothetical protein
MPSTQECDEQSLMTIVALLILEEIYGEREDEWQLIAQKARAYLKKQKIDYKTEMAKLNIII